MNLNKTKLGFFERFGTLLDFLDKKLSSLGFLNRQNMIEIFECFGNFIGLLSHFPFEVKMSNYSKENL